MTTVNIKTIHHIRNVTPGMLRDLKIGGEWRQQLEEILVHYGRDYKQIVGGECKCCACTQRTSKCQAISYSS